MPLGKHKQYPIRSIRIRKARGYVTGMYDVFIETDKRDKEVASGYRTITRPLHLFLADPKWNVFNGY